ncbi:MAG: helix-turn-helix domain-containing protein [Fidelibacterota bacterium]
MSKEKVLDAFQEEKKPMRPGEIAQSTGLDKKDVSKYIKELKNEDKIYSPKRCFYQIK